MKYISLNRRLVFIVAVAMAAPALVFWLWRTGCFKSRDWQDVDIPTECGFGHSDLKFIPIVGGILAPDEEMIRKFNNLEWWRGGCIPEGIDGKKLVCTRCRYAYEEMLGFWRKGSGGKKSFQVALDPIIADFPGDGRYYQTVKDGEVISDSIMCGEKAEAEKIRETILTYLKKRKLQPVEETRHSGERIYQYIFARYRDDYVSVEMMSEKKEDEVHVHAKTIRADRIEDEFLLKQVLGMETTEPGLDIDFKNRERANWGSTSTSRDNWQKFTTGDKEHTYSAHLVHLGDRDGGKEQEVTFTKTNRKTGKVVFSGKKSVIYRYRELTLWEDAGVSVRLR